MKNSNVIVVFAVITVLCGLMMPAFAAPPPAQGGAPKTEQGGGDYPDTPAGPTTTEYLWGKGPGKFAQGDTPPDAGGDQETKDQEQPLHDTDLGQLGDPIADAQVHVPGSAIKMKWPKGITEAIKRNKSNADGRLPTNSETQLYLANFASTLASAMNAPDKQMHSAKANLDSQGIEVANAMADLEKQQASSAIDFCSSFLANFTTDGANKWNKLRDNIFVPMAILLLLPGAVLTQVKAIVSAGSPVLGDSNPFEGIQRSIIAIFLIPGTYLVLNYAIDLNNSVTYSIQDEYTRLFGTNMYRDAISFHIRAFPARQPGENRNALDQQTAKMSPILDKNKTAFAQFEGKMLENKIEDPIANIYEAPGDRTDEALPSSVIAAKTMFNSTNATFMVAWNILCAFQMVYFYYLWFVGPITAALWAWPIKGLRNAFPSWVEGVITLGFWSLFWQTSILLMACFRGVDETGTLVLTALNFLATSSVKYAFDFAGLAKAAGQEAASMAEKAMKSAQGGGGGGKQGGSHAHKGSASHGGARAPQGSAALASNPSQQQAGAQPGTVTPVVASASTSSSNPSGWNNISGNANDLPVLSLASFAPKSAGPVKPIDVGQITPPPTSDKTHNGVISHQPGQDTFKMGDYSLKRGQGEDQLRDSHGNVVASFRPANLADGVQNKMNLPDGGSLTYEKNSNSELFTLADGTHTEQLAFNNANPNAAMHPVITKGQHQIALPTTSGASLLLSNNGNTLSFSNPNGSMTNMDLSTNGQMKLPDGSLVSSTSYDNGADISVSNASNQQTDAFSLINNPNGTMSIGHADGQHNPLGMINVAHTADGGMTSSSYDPSGHLQQQDILNGNSMRSEYYDPTNAQNMLGASETHYNDNGDTITNFLGPDNSLVASSQLQHLPNGGSLESVRDANNHLVSSQQQMPYADGSYGLKNTNYALDGSVSNSSVSLYDQSGNQVPAANIDQSLLAASFSDGDITGINNQSFVDTDFNNNINNSSAPINGQFAPTAGFDPIHIAGGAPIPGGGAPIPGSGAPVPGSNTTAMNDLLRASQLASANLETRSVLPVDLAGTQMPGSQPSLQSEFIPANYASGSLADAQQAGTADVAYYSAVTTSSVDVVPPATAYDSTSVANQNSAFAGDTTTNQANSNLYAQAAPQAQTVYPGAPVPGQSQTVYPGAPVPGQGQTANLGAGSGASAFHAVEAHARAAEIRDQLNPSALANAMQHGRPAEVAYSNPVTMSHVEVVPPAITNDGNDLTYFAASDTNQSSLEQNLSHHTGSLAISPDVLASSVYAAQATPPIRDVHADAQNSGAKQEGQANATQQVLPVDIAGTQMAGSQSALRSEFSQVQGAQVQAGDAQQGRTAEVAYSSPVTTSSVDVVPPSIGYDSASISDQTFAYNAGDSVANHASLEQISFNSAGPLSASTIALGSSVYAAQAAPPVQQVHATGAPVQGPALGQASVVTGGPADHVKSSTLDAAAAFKAVEAHAVAADVRSQIVPGAEPALQTQFSQVQGAHAQAGDAQQGKTAEVAYSSPVTTSSVDVVPPSITNDSASISDQTFAYNAGDSVANHASLEQMAFNNVGTLAASTAALGSSVYAEKAAPPVQGASAPAPLQTANAPASVQTVSGPADYAKSSALDAAAAFKAVEAHAVAADVRSQIVPGAEPALQTQFSQVQGAHAQAGDAQQGKTAEVAYSSPVTTSSVDVVPPSITNDSTSVSHQQFSNDMTTGQSSSLEQVCSNQVGGLTASTAEISEQIYFAQAVPSGQDVLRVPIPELPTYGADAGRSNPTQHVLPVDIAGTQLSRDAVSHHHYPDNNTNTSITTTAAQVSQPQEGGPKRPLTSIFSEIDATAGKKKSVLNKVDKLPAKPPVVDPATQANPKLAPNTPAKDKGDKMTDSPNTKDALPPVHTNQSLEKQMLESGSHVQSMPGSALNAALGRASVASVKAQRSGEHLNNALMDYHSICSLIHEGKVHEAQLVSHYALDNLSKCSGNEPQFQPLVQAFITLFQQKNMIEQVQAFEDKERVFAEKLSATGVTSNIWGF